MTVVVTVLGLATSACHKAEAPAEGAAPTASADAGDFILADLLEPFTPPPLAELETGVEWEAQPVQDALELMRERQSGETPATSAAQQ